MFLLYVDESGDTGMGAASPTDHFVLTGLVVHESRWHETFRHLHRFRAQLHNQHRIPPAKELHASQLVSHRGDFPLIARDERLAILRNAADHLARTPGLVMLNVVVNKREKPADFDVFGEAWKKLLGVFDTLLERGTLEGFTGCEEQGLLLPDATDKRLRDVLRRMLGPDAPPCRLIEDPNFRESHESLFIQGADAAAFLLMQHLRPNEYMKRKSGQNYFRKMEPILWRDTAETDEKGIVWV